MRRRFVMSTLLVVAIVLIGLTVPITLILARAATSELRLRTTQEAETVAALIAADIERGRPIDLSVSVPVVRPEAGVRVLARDGTVLAERPPRAGMSTLVSTVDGPQDTTIEVTANRAQVQRKLRNQLRTLATVAAITIAAAIAVALWQARRLARPLESLSRSATRLGDGNFSAASVATTGIREIDNIARAIRLSANRVERMLESERGFTADATHQLRTGLTGLSVRLELLERHHDPEVHAEAHALLTQIHELNSALDGILAVARTGTTGERQGIDLAALVHDHVADWQARFDAKRRNVVVTIGTERDVIATAGLVGQILNVLFENSLVHGRGTVAVLVHEGAVTIEDEGPGIDPEQAATLFDRQTDHQAAHGRGLPLARRLAESDGGRLELERLRPVSFRLSFLSAESWVRSPDQQPSVDRASPPLDADAPI